MKPITLHPVSVLVGLALAGLVVVAAGATQSRVEPIPSHDAPTVLDRIPADWWTRVTLSAGSYTVPNDRYFVVVATSESSYLNVNGVFSTALSIMLVSTYIGGGDVSLRGNDARVVFDPGAALTGSGTLLGYLEPATAQSKIRPVPAPAVRVVGQVPAKDWVYLAMSGPTTYTVPSDSYLVVVAAQNGGGVLADGVPANLDLLDVLYFNYGGPRNPVGVGARCNDACIAFEPGAVLSGSGQLWGYREPLR